LKVVLSLVAVANLYAGEPPTVTVLTFEMPDMLTCMATAEELGVQGVARRYWRQHMTVEPNRTFYAGENFLAVDLQCRQLERLPD